MAKRPMTPEEEAEFFLRQKQYAEMAGGALHIDPNEGPGTVEDIEFDDEGNPILKD